MPYVGSIQTLTMQGHEGLATLIPHVVEEISRKGVDGVAFVDIGKKSRPCTVVTEFDSSNAGNSKIACEALIKTFVSVITPEGQTLTSVFVHDVKVSGRAGIKAVGGVGAGTWLMTARWVLQATA
jgi:hypothetical protein